MKLQNIIERNERSKKSKWKVIHVQRLEDLIFLIWQYPQYWFIAVPIKIPDGFTAEIDTTSNNYSLHILCKYTERLQNDQLLGHRANFNIFKWIEIQTMFPDCSAVSLKSVTER